MANSCVRYGETSPFVNRLTVSSIRLPEFGAGASDGHDQIADDVGIEAHPLAFPGPPAPAGASAALAV